MKKKLIVNSNSANGADARSGKIKAKKQMKQ
jgi:hypothetical protein